MTKRVIHNVAETLKTNDLVKSQKYFKISKFRYFLLEDTVPYMVIIISH